MFIAVIGNSLVIAAIFRTPTLRLLSTTFFWSLAVLVVFDGLIVEPVDIAKEMTYNSVLGYIWVFLTYGNSGVSLSTF